MWKNWLAVRLIIDKHFFCSPDEPEFEVLELDVVKIGSWNLTS
jgi:hypothetical protein